MNTCELSRQNMN